MHSPTRDPMSLMEKPTYLFRVRLSHQADWVLANRLKQALSAALETGVGERAGFKEGATARIAAGLPRLTFYFGP